jgi:hypothetical protein
LPCPKNTAGILDKAFDIPATSSLGNSPDTASAMRCGDLPFPTKYYHEDVIHHYEYAVCFSIAQTTQYDSL